MFMACLYLSLIYVLGFLQMFTGNRLPSYGGNLTITQRYEALPGGNTYADADVIIRSSGGREFVWMNSQTLPQNRDQTFVVHLIEGSFTTNQQPATRYILSLSVDCTFSNIIVYSSTEVKF